MAQHISLEKFNQIHRLVNDSPGITNAELGRRVGISKDAARKWRHRTRHPDGALSLDSAIPTYIPANAPQTEAEPNVLPLPPDVEHSLKRENKRLRQRVNELMDSSSRDTRFNELADQISSANVEIPKWTQKRSRGRDNATAVAMLSDWHLDEVVYAEQVDGCNAFNRKIAETRCGQFFDNVDTLCHTHLKGVDYDGLYLLMAGDTFSGFIHEELEISNESTIMDSLIHWTPILVSGIRHLADKFGHVHIPVVVGNHGRKTRKPVAKNRAQDNFDYLFAHMLALQTQGDERITWQIAQAADCRFELYDTTILLTHGDQFRGGGGISGAACVTPDTPILMADLSYRPAGDLRAGDLLVGFDDETETGQRRRFKTATVTEGVRRHLPCFEIETDDGQKTVATTDHPWLIRSGISHAWSRTENLHVGSRILSLGPPWVRHTTFEAGYLSGMLDGEGHVEASTSSARIGISQQHNACLTQTLAILDELGIEYSKDSRASRDPRYGNVLREAVCHLRLPGGVYQTLRILGEFQPKRLLDEKGERVWSGRSVQICKEARVVGIRDVGTCEVAAFSTSTGTYVANGMLSHNTPWALGDHKKRRRMQGMGLNYSLLCFGHWHQLTLGMNGIIANGALKGFDEFAYVSNFAFEPPQQALFLVQPEVGVTMRAPIHVLGDDEKY